MYQYAVQEFADLSTKKFFSKRLVIMGFLGDSDAGFDPRVRKNPQRREWQCTPVFSPTEPMDRGTWWATVHEVTESDMTEAKQQQLSIHRNFTSEIR